MRTSAGGQAAEHPPEDTFMIPGYGAQPVPPEKYVADNDNVPARARLEDVSGDWLTGGAYIGLTRREVEAQPAGEHHVEPRSAFPDDDLATATFAPLEEVESRKGSFMQTYSGRKFWPLDPRPEEVHIEDIAHSLSLQCRYAGHCISFYSVAEHSVHVARWLLTKFGPLTALHGLLHDAPEAYVVDVPRPLKRHLDHYRAIEERVWRQAVAPRFGLAAIIPAAVHEADNRIIADELKLLRPMEWHARHDDPLGVPVAGWHPDAAEDEFLACYVMLERKLKEEGRR